LYDLNGQAIGHIRNKKILDKKGQTLYYTNWFWVSDAFELIAI
jgi:hypothetical protein